MKTQTKKIIEVEDWDDCVEKTYGRPYSFQQQGGCQDRGLFYLLVPSEPYDYKEETIPEIVNHDERGVSFAAWLTRNPKQKLSNPKNQEDHCIKLWWMRNFYPDIQMIANDLHSKGLLEAGEYFINID